MKRITSWLTSQRIPIAATFLVVVSLVLFLPALRYEFTNYDESSQVVNNPLVRSLSPPNIVRIFSAFCISSYYPVRLLSFAFDYRCWGLNPLGFHLTNIVLHGFNVLLLFLLMVRFGGSGTLRHGGRGVWLAVLCACFFAAHPLAVEPVAWISGREELLAVFFTLSCMHLWFGAILPVGEFTARLRAPVAYSLALFCMACACLSNAVGAVIPAILLAASIAFAGGPSELCRPWPWIRAAGAHFRVAWPFWVLAVATVILKVYGESRALALGINVRPDEQLGLLLRFYVVPCVFAMNIHTFLWPFGLMLLYPSLSLSAGTLVLFFTGVALLIAAAFLLWRWLLSPDIAGRRTAFGLMWFLLGVLPSAHVLSHHLIRADRLLYPALCGLGFVLFSWLDGYISKKREVQGLVAGILGLVLLGLAIRTHDQLPVWRSSVTLFENAVQMDPTNADAHLSLGMALRADGKLKEARDHLVEALRLHPENAQACQELAAVLIETGNARESVSLLDHAIALRPTDARNYHVKGVAMTHLGRRREAMELFRLALKRNPALTDARTNLGMLLADEGMLTEAMAQHEEAIRGLPDSAHAHVGMGTALFRAGRWTEALENFETALRLDPNLVSARYNAALACSKLGRMDEAVRHYRESIRLAPGDLDAMRELAEVLIRLGRQGEAEAVYRKSLEVDGRQPFIHNNLGVLLAGRGRKAEAIEHYREALRLNPGYAEASENMAEALKR